MPYICHCFPLSKVSVLSQGTICISNKDRYSIMSEWDPDFLRSSNILRNLLRKVFNGNRWSRIQLRDGRYVQTLWSIEYNADTCAILGDATRRWFLVKMLSHMLFARKPISKSWLYYYYPRLDSLTLTGFFKKLR
jgi:hypothetical protein